MDPYDLHEQCDEITALGYMQADRRLPLDQVKRLRKADFRGEGFYYLPEDLMWACEPTDEDPGATAPRLDATPYFKDGTPWIPGPV